MIGHKRNPHILKRLLAMMLMLALLPGAVLAESEQAHIPDSLRNDALETAQKLYRLPEATRDEEGDMRYHFFPGACGYYKSTEERLNYYGCAFMLDWFIPNETWSRRPSHMSVSQLQIPGENPEVSRVELFYPYWESFRDTDFPESTDEARKAVAREWAQNYVLLPEEDLQGEWTRGLTDETWDHRQIVQYTLMTPDWEISLWLYPNSMRYYEAVFYSRKWYNEAPKNYTT